MKKKEEKVEEVVSTPKVEPFTLDTDFGRTDLNEAFAKIAAEINKLKGH